MQPFGECNIKDSKNQKTQKKGDTEQKTGDSSYDIYMAVEERERGREMFSARGVKVTMNKENRPNIWPSSDFVVKSEWCVCGGWHRAEGNGRQCRQPSL